MNNQNKGGGLHSIYKTPLKSFRKYIAAIVFLFFINASYSPAQQLPGSSTRNNNPDLEKMVRSTLRNSSRSLQLIENNGQQGLSKDVIAYFTSRYETVFIEKNRLRIVVTQEENNKESKPAVEKKSYRFNSFSIEFKGAMISGQTMKKDPFETKRNYITANNGTVTSVAAASCSEIILKDIYKGIDLRLYSQQNGHLEFDWIIYPGAATSQVKMQFKGQDKLSLTKEGSLKVQMKMGSFVLHLPESYFITSSGKMAVPARFSIGKGQVVSFKGVPATSKYPLVIDPDLLWGTFFDGANTNFDEYLYGIDYNSNNDKIYCSGAASLQVSTLYAAALSTAYDSTFEATPDVLAYAISKDGQFVTNITYLGGAGADVGVGVSSTASFVYFSGYTASADFPVTKAANGNFEAFDTTYHGNTDGFIAIFNPDLDKLFYCSYLGSDGTDKALTVRAVQDSVYYISLSSADTLSDTSPNYIVNAADSSMSGNSEAWIGKFSGFSLLDFGTYVGGTSDDIINDFQVLSDSDVVFAGSTRNITEVNETIANGSGTDALYGRINVPSAGPVTFDILDKFGGSGTDNAWGILALGDSVSVLTGQTSSNGFPLGSGTVIQNTRAGQVDGFIAKIYNDGSGSYKATFLGGSDDDILVSARPVVVNSQVALLSWGTTASTDLAVRNLGAGTFYSPNNTGGLDMVFAITDLDFVTKYYLSYIGGSANDYLGATGAPIGANHVFYNPGDSTLYVGTTTHSNQTTHVPLFVGRGPADFANYGVPVFDNTKNNSNNDTHVIIALSMKGLIGILATSETTLDVQNQGNCSMKLVWETISPAVTDYFTIERSTDGRQFAIIGTSYAIDKASCFFFDNPSSLTAPAVFYRVGTHSGNGAVSYSNTRVVKNCGAGINLYKIYPTVVSHSFTLSGLSAAMGKTIQTDMYDAVGKKVMSVQKQVTQDAEMFLLPFHPSPGTYFIQVREASANTVLFRSAIVIGR